jgi:hypothetical protein
VKEVELVLLLVEGGLNEGRVREAEVGCKGSIISND